MSQQPSSGAMNGSGQPISWRVIQQVQGTQRTPAGGFEQGVTITYQLSSGEQGSVFVPQRAYTTESARAAVEAAARQMVDIARLSGQVG